MQKSCVMEGILQEIQNESNKYTITTSIQHCNRSPHQYSKAKME